MYHHPDLILALHHERQHRLEAEAARSALVRALRRRHRFGWRRPRGMPPAPMWLHLRSFSMDLLVKRL
jgi:hypothetical protein